MKDLKTDIFNIAKVIKKVTLADPLAKNRQRENVDARFILYKLSKDLLSVSYIKLGKILGKNHATVLYGYNKVRDLMATDKQFKRNYYAWWKVVESLELQSMIDRDEFVLDYVELKENYDKMIDKYNKLVIQMENTAYQMIEDQFKTIQDSVIRRILEDKNCSFDLSRTLHRVLAKNEK